MSVPARELWVTFGSSQDEVPPEKRPYEPLRPGIGPWSTGLCHKGEVIGSPSHTVEVPLCVPRSGILFSH